MSNASQIFTNDEVDSIVPHPVLESHPEWTDMYWDSWRKVSSSSILHSAQTGIPLSPIYFDENLWGGRNWMFQWDTCLMMMFGRYGFKLFPTLESLDNFYRLQFENGYISRMIKESTGKPSSSDTARSNSNPPLFSWAEWQHYLVTQDPQHFTRNVMGFNDGRDLTILQRIVNHFYWLKENRRWDDGYY